MNKTYLYKKIIFFFFLNFLSNFAFGQVWTIHDTIVPPRISGSQFHFGNSISMEGNIAVVGAPLERESTGGAYILQKKGIDWNIIGKLTASDEARNRSFGAKVKIDNDVIIVTAPGPRAVKS